jgi:hypothetical protein
MSASRILLKAAARDARDGTQYAATVSIMPAAMVCDGS